MIIEKRRIVAELRRRGQDHRADFVDRQLPAEIDTGKHVGILATLNIDLEELAAAEAPADSEQP